MTEYLELLKIFTNFGISGLLVFVIWRLVDKWAGPFLAAQQSQARAMGELASAVKESQNNMQDLLLAMRVMATKLDDVKECVDTIAEAGCGGKCHAG